MTIQELKMGLLVKDKHEHGYGLIVGIAENTCKEPIAVVQFQAGATIHIHLCNLILIN